MMFSMIYDAFEINQIDAIIPYKLFMFKRNRYQCGRKIEDRCN